jgi:hypothetical protein
MTFSRTSEGESSTRYHSLESLTKFYETEGVIFLVRGSLKKSSKKMVNTL